MALVTLVLVLALATSAEGRQKRIPWLTFNEVSLNGETRVLSSHEIFSYGGTSLSPDQRHFAYVPYTCDGCPYSTSLMVSDVRGPGGQVLVEASHGIRDVAWAPNGDTIAFSSDALWLVDADGTNLRRVGEGGIDPAWSPDSSQIAYMTSSASNWHIRVLTLASGAVRDLVDGQNFRWSPDGTRIVYEKVGGGACRVEVRVTTVQNGGSRAIACGFLPRWSPDAKRIAFVRYEDYMTSLWVIPSRGGKPRRLATARGGGAALAMWSPNGRWLAFQQGARYCASKLAVVPSGGGRTRRIASHTRMVAPIAWSGRRKVLYSAERCSDQ